ncbi:phosphoribosyltransferase-like protein [Paraburkholderia caffeinilytica]|uniref:phosphoribosyltransferase n=1 Tax=Paraburkholderia caffeinilytica TaxID=1761016 RepID=UPI003DA0C3CD
MRPEKWRKGLVIELARLYSSNAWLALREAALQELIDDYCQDSSEQELILQLLNHFRFLSSQDYQECLNKISDYITKTLNLTASDVLLVSPTCDEHADSGQVVLYDLKNTLLSRAGWLDVTTCSFFGKAQRHIKEDSQILLVDEFIGTGRTYIGRIREMRRHFQSRGIGKFEIHGVAIASTPHGKDHIAKETGIDIHSVLSCGKAIDEILPSSAKASNYQLMDALESRLSANYEAHILPKLGDGSCESLYGREGGNCPNSVLPVFWWPLSVDQKRRRTILNRSFGK